MNAVLTPKGFLTIGGVIVLLYGIVGFLVPDQHLLADLLLFTGAENIAHVVLGIVAIAAGYVLGADLQKWLTAVVGATALVFLVIGLIVMGTPPLNLGLANLELVDDVVHLVVGIWALWAAFRPMGAIAPQSAAA
jgi:hypothetical protein